jgi:class 3 adenylate cyclase
LLPVGAAVPFNERCLSVGPLKPSAPLGGLAGAEVGSDEIAPFLGIEFRGYAGRVHQMTAVTELGGKVAKKLGDGLMALFGYPVAQENDAERAVRAAIAVQRALAELNRKNAGTRRPALAARIAIDSGPVVVDATGEILGEVPSIAARAQALAEPGAVVVTARVQRQIAGLFVVDAGSPSSSRNSLRTREISLTICNARRLRY